MPAWANLSLLLALWPACLLPHEFWIEPLKWQYPEGAMIEAHLRNGEGFDGIALSWFDRHVHRSQVALGTELRDIKARMGARPAFVTPARGAGLAVLLHETTPSHVTYKTWEHFQTFVDHKDLNLRPDDHRAAGHPETNFRESYTRHAKALVAGGAGGAGGRGADRAFGMETEFVALHNPYRLAQGSPMRVRLLYRGAPRANAQIEIFERAPSGTVAIATTHTDAAGLAVVTTKAGHDYLLDAVVLREAKTNDAAYQTLWASLTFHVPR